MVELVEQILSRLVKWLPMVALIWVLNYLVIGIIVQMLLQGLSKMLESPKLTFKEGLGTVVVWPLAVILFTWFFVKGYLRR